MAPLPAAEPTRKEEDEGAVVAIVKEEGPVAPLPAGEAAAVFLADAKDKEEIVVDAVVLADAKDKVEIVVDAADADKKEEGPVAPLPAGEAAAVVLADAKDKEEIVVDAVVLADAKDKVEIVVDAADADKKEEGHVAIHVDGGVPQIKAVSLALDYTCSRNVFGKLALVYLFTASASVAAAVFVPPADLARGYVWLAYFIGLITSWSVSLLMRCGVNEPCKRTILPLLCFMSNNISSMLFSTAWMGHVSLRAAVINALTMVALLIYCSWGAWRKREANLGKLGLFGFTALLGMCYLDLVLTPLVLSPSKLYLAGKVVAKVSYVRVLINMAFLLYDAGKLDKNTKDAAGQLYVDASTDTARHVLSIGISLFFVG